MPGTSSSRSRSYGKLMKVRQIGRIVFATRRRFDVDGSLLPSPVRLVPPPPVASLSPPPGLPVIARRSRRTSFDGYGAGKPSFGVLRRFFLPLVTSFFSPSASHPGL